MDKTQQTYRALFSCPIESDPGLPPLSQFIRHEWIREAGLNPSIDSPSGRTEFLFRHLRLFYASRAPFRPQLPAPLVEWLNAPSLDVSAHIHTHPALAGSQPCFLPKQLTRLMMHVWTTEARHFDVFEESGFYRFLTHYALFLMKTWKLPPALLPRASVDLLNLKAADDATPLTVCMLMNEQTKQPRLSVDMRPPELYARCFGALADVMELGDSRLLPSYVSEYWRQRVPADSAVTAYEYVAAGAFADLRVRNGEAPVRDWFLSSYVATHPWATALSGPSTGSKGRQAAAQKPLENAVLSYRDHKTVCGLSKAGIYATNALREAGFHVFDLDYALPRNRMDEEHKRNASVLANAQRNLHLLNINLEYVPECILLNAPRVQPRDYIVGQFYWELSSISAIHETGLDLVDEVWVASSYLVDVFSQHTDKPVINMGQAVAEHAQSTLGRAHFGLPLNDYLFLLNFDAMSCVERKNPLAAARAFRIAFPAGSERAGLIIKTRNVEGLAGNDLAHWNMILEEAQRDKRIRIINRTLTEAELTGLIDSCDCYVTLHRSEGFGYGAAEALAQAKPVITTDYSGVRDFCTGESSLLIPYDLVAVEPGAYPYMDADRSYLWANPDVAAAGQEMRRLVRNPEQGRALGEQGRRVIQSQFSRRALSARYTKRLSELAFHPANCNTTAFMTNATS